MYINSQHGNTYQVGGSLSSDSPSYISRASDVQLYNAIQNGEFCYVLAARQMGKSSLRVRTMNKLTDEGIHCISLEMTQFGSSNTNAEQWYYSFLHRISQTFGMTKEFRAWWSQKVNHTPVSRFKDYAEEFLLPNITGRIVVFLDEIDSIMSLNKELFNTDDFFATIRNTYNSRADNAELNRLSFVIIGTATPSDLINDTLRTPFNIGVPIPVSYFTNENLEPLLSGFLHLGTDHEYLLSEILRWTGGQPVLTQKLCMQIAQNESGITDVSRVVDNYVNQLFLNPLEQDNNLDNVATRILNDKENVIQMLGLYLQIYQGKVVRVLGASKPQIYLKLSGLVVECNGELVISNDIYKAYFSDSWVVKSLAQADRLLAKEINVWLQNKKKLPFKLNTSVIDSYSAWANSGVILSELEYEFLTYLLELDRSSKRVKVRNIRIASSVMLALIIGISVLAFKLNEKYQELDNEKKKVERLNVVLAKKYDSEKNEKEELVDVIRYAEAQKSMLISEKKRIIVLKEAEKNAFQLFEKAEKNPTIAFNGIHKQYTQTGSETAKQLLYKINYRYNRYKKVTAVSNSYEFAYFNELKKLFYIVESGKLQILSINGELIRDIPIPDKLILHAEVSNDGSLFMASFKSEIFVLSISDNKSQTIKLPIKSSVSIALLPSNKIAVASINGSVIVLNRTGKIECTFKLNTPIVSMVYFESTDRIAITSGRNTILFYGLDGQKDGFLTLDYKCNKLHFIQDKKSLIAVGQNNFSIINEEFSLLKTVRLTGLVVKNIDYCTTKDALLVSLSNGSLYEYRINDGYLQNRFVGQSGVIRAAGYFENELLTLGRKGEILKWKPISNRIYEDNWTEKEYYEVLLSSQNKLCLMNNGDIEPLNKKSIEQDEFTIEGAYTLSTTKSTKIAVAANATGLFCVDMHAKKTIFNVPEKSIVQTVISNSGKMFAYSTYHGKITLRNSNGEKVFDFRPHRTWAESLLFTKNGDYLISGGNDGSTYIYSVPKGELTKGVQHNDVVTSVKQWGKYIVCSSLDKTVTLQSVDGELINRYEYNSGVTVVYMAEEDGIVYTGHTDGKIIAKTLSGIILLEIIVSRTPVKNVFYENNIIWVHSQDGIVRKYLFDGGLKL